MSTTATRPALRARALASRGRALSAATLLAVAIGAIAGCGSSSAPGSSADPATLVPASASLYAGATVRPVGAEKTAALAAGAALTHQADPYMRLLAALQTPGSKPLDFAHDVDPWLGPHAGIFLTSLSSSSSLLSLLEAGLLGGNTSSAAFPFSASGAQGALVLDTSDSNKARSFLDAQAKLAGAHAASYRGIAYHTTTAGVSFGLVDRLAVIGSDSGFRSVVDTARGGAPLSSSSEYSKLLAKAPAEALAHVYSRAAAKHTPGAQEGLAGVLALLAGGHSANISLVPSAGSLVLDADTLTSGAGGEAGGLLSSDPEAVQGLGELRSDSWLAIGLGHLASALPGDAKELGGLASLSGSSSAGAASSSFGLQSLLGALTTPLSKLGADTPQARRDYTSWMGPGGVFASGSGLLELQAGVVIASSNAARSRAAVAQLGRELSRSGIAVAPADIPGTEAAIGARLTGLPLVLDIAAGRAADGQPKFVLGLGEASVEGALHPPGTLAGSPAYSAAATSLGEGAHPQLIISFPTLLSLLEGVGLLEEPTIAKFVPYLRNATTLVGGGHELDAEITRFRLVLGLQAPGG